MAGLARIDRQTFLTYLHQSGLVTPEQLAPVLAALPDVNRGRVIARALVEQGLLTRFQAERVLVGRTAGFHLGQYRILEEVGRGGMGRVFRSEHRTMKRIVALKVLTAELFKAERALELFLHEVRAAARLVHPNIVTAYDANEVGGRYYLVLEYVDGPNLDQLVRKQGPLSVGLACDYVRQAASGLQCAHALGMLHRDIKPANIIVQWHGLNGPATPGLVKIGDFGLARLCAPAGTSLSGHGTILTRENTVMGTPDYLSPEQARNLHHTDIRSDLYSLGCTFYFLLAGSVPFAGGTALEKLIRHSTAKPQALWEFRGDVPDAVLAIVQKLMAKDPSERFQTPAELADALAPYAVSGPTPWAPRPPAPLEPDAEEPAFPDAEPDGEDLPPSDDELAALDVTVANDPSPTPGRVVSPSLLPPGRKRRKRWSLSFALFLLVLLGGLGMLAYLGWAHGMLRRW
jgi:serine/threonine protein kinase